MNQYVLFAVLSCSLLACGSDADSPPPVEGQKPGDNASPSPSGKGASPSAPSGDTCQDVTRYLCERASACNDDGRVVLSLASGASAKHDTSGNCATYYAALTCRAPSTVDWASCKAALSKASCSPSSQGNAISIEICKGLTL